YTLQHMMDVAAVAEASADAASTGKSVNATLRNYVRDAKSIAVTHADVKEYPNSYVFIIDMPRLKSADIKVQVEGDNVLVISGERKREDEKDGAKYLRIEQRVGKLMRKFLLPENANTDKISAVCQDGVLIEFLWSRISLKRNSEVQRKLVKTQRIQRNSEIQKF
ncbi:17.9 kDa class II heat shock protein-like, partial [Camellia sinensis]|uniref:17.9 kDa class II heat shock protein-like n=1 Tax=Camellia sinensis TaxID=4442 RepID=UPI0010360371